MRAGRRDARVDRCVSAMLLTAWIALKLGDRVAIQAFDSRPRLASGFVSGGGAFAQLERLAAGIDYSADETNYTFALTTLAARLTRRSMVVLFTEFTDAVSADFMLRALRRLVETHLIMVVVLRDEELEAIAAARPRGRRRRHPGDHRRGPAQGSADRSSPACSILASMSLKANMTRSASGWCRAISSSRRGTCCECAAGWRRRAPRWSMRRGSAQAHEGDWARLEQIVTRMEKRSIRSLGDDDLLALPALYRTTLSSLSVARDTSLDRALITYLERLSTRAYFQIYGVQTPALRQFARFFARQLARGGAHAVARDGVLRRSHLRRRAISRIS